MSSKKVDTKEKAVSKSQQEILNLLYSFRFGTSDHIAVALGKKNGSYVYERLRRLLELGYIGRRYDGSYKLAGRPAAYYLLAKGIRTLQAMPDTDQRTLKNAYKDRGASDRFITHQLAVFDIYCQFKQKYKDPQFFTKPELNNFEYFPDPLPDAFVYIHHENIPQEQWIKYLVECFEESTPFFMMKRRIRFYEDYVYSDEFKDATSVSTPVILLACDSKKLQSRAQQYINRQIDDESIFLVVSGNID